MHRVQAHDLGPSVQRQFGQSTGTRHLDSRSIINEKYALWAIQFSLLGNDALNDDGDSCRSDDENEDVDYFIQAPHYGGYPQAQAPNASEEAAPKRRRSTDDFTVVMLKPNDVTEAHEDVPGSALVDEQRRHAPGREADDYEGEDANDFSGCRTRNADFAANHSASSRRTYFWRSLWREQNWYVCPDGPVNVITPSFVPTYSTMA